MKQGSGFAKEGRKANRKGRRLPKLVVRRAPLLRLLLLLGRAADDASDDVGCICFARAQHYRRDASLRAQRRDGRGARADDFRHHGLGWKNSAKRICSDPKQKYNMGSIDLFRRDDQEAGALDATFVFVLAFCFRRFLGHLLRYCHYDPSSTQMPPLQRQHLAGP